MKLNALLNRILQDHPIPANMTPNEGVAVLFTDEDDVVYALKGNMDEDRFRLLCQHVLDKGPAKPLAVKLHLKP